MNSTFKTLSEINVNHRTEKKAKLTYLSWAWAWAEACKACPDVNYTVDEYDGKPYLFDENLGYLVSTKVTINGVTKPMSLPVMDGANNAMKHVKYSYQVQEWVNRQKTGKMIDKWVEPATMFDINKTMMRCLVKNLAMFGLGLYIYAGEDLPDVVPDKISEDAIQKLQTFIESKGYTSEQICQSYGISSLSEFNADQPKAVCEQINAWVKQSQQGNQ